MAGERRKKVELEKEVKKEPKYILRKSGRSITRVTTRLNIAKYRRCNFVSVDVVHCIFLAFCVDFELSVLVLMALGARVARSGGDKIKVREERTRASADG